MLSGYPLNFSLLIIGLLASLNPCYGHESNSLNHQIHLMPSIGEFHHTVNTDHSEAQQYFNQGLLLIYAFNHDAAYLSFQKALEIDHNLAMAYWGMALALGPNLNKAITSPEEITAYKLIQKARALKTTKPEQSYIEALAQRYSDSPKSNYSQLDRNYAEAMRKLSQNYPEDLDAMTLYAESMMDLNAWKLWTLDGKPTEGTIEIVKSLESVMKKDPHHIGANHYYIHAVEASKNPEYALMSANRLRSLNSSAGHLSHMPSHIYFRVGDYESSAKSNVKAVKDDRAYIQEYGMEGFYPFHYLTHNYDFLIRSYSMLGQYNEALKSADELAIFSKGHFQTMPELEFRMLIPKIFVLLRFQKWNEILQLSKPNPEMLQTTAIWIAAKGMAYAALGNIKEANNEKVNLQAAIRQIPPEAFFGLNNAKKVLNISLNMLDASIASANHQEQQVIKYLSKAVNEEDSLAYDEPANWYYPIRETLGGQLLKLERYNEAEIVFRKTLEDYPRNGRALFGLIESLKGQKRLSEIFWVQQQFNDAWKQADAPLTINNL